MNDKTFKFCPSCGGKMDKNAKFCPLCGAKQPVITTSFENTDNKAYENINEAPAVEISPQETVFEEPKVYEYKEGITEEVPVYHVSGTTQEYIEPASYTSPEEDPHAPSFYYNPDADRSAFDKKKKKKLSPLWWLLLIPAVLIIAAIVFAVIFITKLSKLPDDYSSGSIFEDYDDYMYENPYYDDFDDYFSGDTGDFDDYYDDFDDYYSGQDYDFNYENAVPFNLTGTFENTVLYNMNGLKITAIGDEVYYDEYCVYLPLYIENGTGSLMSVTQDYMTVNGRTVYSYLYSEIEAGHKDYCVAEIYFSDIYANGITDLAELDFNFIFHEYIREESGSDTFNFYTESYEEVDRPDTLPIRTSAFNTYTPTEFDGKFICDNEYITAEFINLKKYNNGEYYAVFEITNKTSEAFYTKSYDVTFNDHMVWNSVSCPLLPYSSCVYYLPIGDSDVAAIEKMDRIDTLTMSFELYELVSDDFFNFEPMYKTETVTINLSK